MSDVLSQYMQGTYEWDISVTDPPLSYIKQQGISRFQIALAVNIPYPLLKIWNENVQEGCDYIDFLNATVTRSWFKVSRETGYRIQGRLEREAGVVASKYRQTKGRKRQQLNSKCLTLSILHSELVSIEEMERDLIITRDELSDWKKKFDDLEAEKQKLINEMRDVQRNKEEEIIQLEAAGKELKDYVDQLERQSGLTCQSKKVGEVGQKQRQRKVKLLKERAECALWFAKSFGLELSCLKFKDVKSNETYSLDYQTPTTSRPEEAAETSQEELSESQSSQIEQILFLLDKFYVSDQFYHELTVTYEDMPRSYLIKQLRSDLNKVTHIESVPGIYPGAQCNFEELLTQHVKDYLTDNPAHNPNDAIKIKVSMDGARMSRTTNFLILSFCLLQNEENAMSSKGNRTIAVVNGPEGYDTVRDSLKKPVEEINNLIAKKSINFNGKNYALDFFLGGDYKILLIVMGLSGATSDYACLWCKIHKLVRFDMSKPKDHYNSPPISRTLHEMQEMCSLPQSQSRYSCVRKPLINIALDHVILDELHLMLRVTDRLMENLIKEVIERDGEADLNKKRGEEKGLYLKKLVKEINKTGITFNVWEKKNADGKGSGLYDWTSLLGSDKKKLMNKLPGQLESSNILFPETKQTVIEIWTTFCDLYNLITISDVDKTTGNQIFEQGKEWINLFCSLGGKRQGYEKTRVTPYMHCIPYHIPKFVSDHGSLKMFTGQGVEKNNDDAKKLYFQKSNKWDATQDVLQLEARQYALRGQEREKRKYTKRKADYWESEISETRKKRPRPKVGDDQNEMAATSTSSSSITRDLSKLTVKELRHEIHARGLKPKGLSKMNKTQLLSLLQ